MISFSLLSLAAVANAATIPSPAVSLAGSQTLTAPVVGTVSKSVVKTAPVAVSSKPATILGTSYIASPIQSVMPKAYVKETGTPLQYSYKVTQAPQVPTTPMVATRSIPIAQTASYTALPTTSYMIPTPAPTYTSTTYSKMTAPVTTIEEPSPAPVTREFLAVSDEEETGGSGMEVEEPTPVGKKHGCC